MTLVVLMILCTVLYASFEIFAGLAGNHINSWLAAVMYNGIGTLVPLIVYLSVASKGKTTAKGIFFAGLAGVGIMLFSVIFARIFALGGDLPYVIPVIYGGAIVLSSMFGWLVLRDRLSLLQGAGLMLILAGITLVVVAKARVA